MEGRALGEVEGGVEREAIGGVERVGSCVVGDGRVHIGLNHKLGRVGD